LRAEKHQLAQVKTEEQKERDAYDEKQQAIKTAQVQKDMAVHVTQEMYDHRKADSTVSTSFLTNAAAAGIAAEEEDEAAKPKGVSNHELQVRAARNLEMQRQAYFQNTVAALKKADLKSRKERAELAGTVAVKGAVEVKGAVAVRSTAKNNVAKTPPHGTAALPITPPVPTDTGYQALGLASNIKIAHVMSDDYHADVALASVEDAQRQHALEHHIHTLRTKEGLAAAVKQVQVNEKTEQSLTTENEAAGYPGLPQVESNRMHRTRVRKAHLDTMENENKLGREIANQFDIEKTPTQRLITAKTIDSREVEVNQIMGV